MITVAGEALIDIVIGASGSITALPGGAPFNVARTIARLGGTCQFLGKLSDDTFGEQLQASLQRDGVNIAVANVTPAPTTLAIARLDKFGTAEYRVLAEENRSGLRSAAEVPDTVSMVTPSRWSALAYERFGLPRERIHVVPHGIDPAVVRPDAAARNAAREALGLRDAFVYLSVGAMTWNKGPDVLLAAFARIAETEPEARLFLKGADALYPSREMVRSVLDDLSARARETVAARLIYNGETYSARMMADLLCAADCYVSPYRAEGFNLPVLEAVACGVPAICTAGGPTDEFTQESFARRIRSRPARMPSEASEAGDYLEPDLDHLVELMRQALREREGATRMGAAGAAYVAQNLTWGRVTDRLLEALFP